MTELEKETCWDKTDGVQELRGRLDRIRELLANTTPSESARATEQLAKSCEQQGATIEKLRSESARLTEEKRILTDRLSESIEAQNQEALRQASESARLREINAELITALADTVQVAEACASCVNGGIDGMTKQKLSEARAALKKAKDAQGGQGS